ncbi:MAG: hypothetical protein DRJ38_02210 [Thermoprotei archaeon]|nr:MAG: hypothetical protein DRJ38_02210 [Thermoprotei archaeon]
MKCIVTHGDLDGLTAAAILVDVLRQKREKSILLIAQPFTLANVLSKIVSFETLSRLYIIDVGLDPGTWEQAKRHLARIRLKADVIWIDHHRATLKKMEELSKLGISLIYSIDGSAASIVKYVYLEKTSNPDFYSKLALIGEIGDKVKETENEEITKLAEILGSSLSADSDDDEFKVKLVQFWVKEQKFYDEEVEKRARQAKERLQELIKKAKNRVVFDGEKLILIDFRGVPARGYIGKVASDYTNKTGKVVIVIFNSGPTEVVATCRVPQTLDINALNLLMKLAYKFGGSGGGHPKACSIRIPIAHANALKKELERLDRVLCVKT